MFSWFIAETCYDEMWVKVIWNDADLTAFTTEETCENTGDCMYFQDDVCYANELGPWEDLSDWQLCKYPEASAP
jgi:hypothetical protein